MECALVTGTTATGRVSTVRPVPLETAGALLAATCPRGAGAAVPAVVEGAPEPWLAEPESGPVEPWSKTGPAGLASGPAVPALWSRAGPAELAS